MTRAERELVELIARVAWRRLRERRERDTLPPKQQEERRESRAVRPLFDRSAK